MSWLLEIVIDSLDGKRPAVSCFTFRRIITTTKARAA